MHDIVIHRKLEAPRLDYWLRVRHVTSALMHHEMVYGLELLLENSILETSPGRSAWEGCCLAFLTLGHAANRLVLSAPEQSVRELSQLPLTINRIYVASAVIDGDHEI
jgi:hypothetical protein